MYELQEIAPGASAPMRDTAYQWTADSAGNAYLSRVTMTLDKGQAWAQTTTSTLDALGNVRTLSVSDYNSGSQRTYTNTYSYSNWPCWPLCNRLNQSTLTSGSNSVTLVTNTYDGDWPSLPQGGAPREHDPNYTRNVLPRGNVTMSVTPGHTVNTQYDTTGTVVSQDDGNGHSVRVATSDRTNFTQPDKLDPNGTGQLVTSALYNTASFSPTSVASPYQTVFDPYTNDSSGTAAYTTYDGWGRIYEVYPPGGYSVGVKTAYRYYNESLPWTIKATTQNATNAKVQTQTLDGLGRTVSAATQPSITSSPISEVDTAYAPCACSPLGKMSSHTCRLRPRPRPPPTNTTRWAAPPESRSRTAAPPNTPIRAT